MSRPMMIGSSLEEIADKVWRKYTAGDHRDGIISEYDELVRRAAKIIDARDAEIATLRAENEELRNSIESINSALEEAEVPVTDESDAVDQIEALAACADLAEHERDDLRRLLHEADLSLLAEQGVGGAPSEEWTFVEALHGSNRRWNRGRLDVIWQHGDDRGWAVYFAAPSRSFRSNLPLESQFDRPSNARSLMIAADKWAAEHPELMTPKETL